MIIHARDNQIEIAAPAKVNLFLELLARRDDGFHEIETVMSSISIFDFLRFTPREDSELVLSLSMSNQGELTREQDEIPIDDRNLVKRALHLVRATAQRELGRESCETGIDVHLHKNIPSAAGLGGASSNAAAALVAANRIWNLNWPIKKLSALASQLGSDIAFFLLGGMAICRGRGERVDPIMAPAQIPIVVAKPPFSLSTATVFDKVSFDEKPKHSAELVQCIQRFNSGSIGNRMFNRLQQFAEPLNQSIAGQFAQLRLEFTRLNCLGHQMSGSGSSYFGLFSNARIARQAANRLSSRIPHVRIILSQTLIRPALNETTSCRFTRRST
jgi:4-diphosphocytidyl-2-C-methyl-D-erythritol kinase